ncbi:MAG TPA: ribonuclease E/G, partial [Methylomirabilota bacterium]|nr:ribonuclease E/G [Methylomirabilota bacterium]
MSEGSHITCPRCNGTGHIRDTESSALQILRMVQEESMKDNTAAVHVQVPVEVTSFLLNEKRTEITKIELKQRVTVLLVPNKHLDTPNYKLERLRHDDPRLEGLQASYTMIEEPEDEVGITRREKSTKPKQEPVIKGILPETPAPKAEPKPEPKPVAVPAPVAAAPAPAPVAAAAGGGFFAWIKKVFGGAPEAAAPQPALATVPAAAPAPSGRGDERRGERGGRGGRGGRRDGKGNGEGRDTREGRGPRGERGERGEARPERGDRGPRREEPRGEAIAGERDERAARGEQRRGPRPERETQRPAEAAEAGVPVQALAETMAEGAEGAESQADREGRRRRRRRGGRGRDEAGLGATPEGVSAEIEAVETAEAPAGEEAVTGERPEGEDREGEGRGRRRGGRDRYRRERREGETVEGGAVQGMEPAAAAEAVAPQAKPWWEASADAGSVVAAPAATVAEATPAIETPVAAAPIVVEPFVLPTDELQRVAEGAGLQWVNSDADKIRAVQEAMANEPRPIHVPRERKPTAVIDEGPLVLVETRKDLSQLKLPFDHGAGAR